MRYINSTILSKNKNKSNKIFFVTDIVRFFECLNILKCLSVLIEIIDNYYKDYNIYNVCQISCNYTYVNALVDIYIPEYFKANKKDNTCL